MSKWEPRFWAKVDVRGDDECWVWSGAKQRRGYGAFGIRHGVTRSAHRLSWELAHGPIPDGLWVLHRCDNPPCVNPSHLSLGTRADNMRQMVERRRHWAHRGLYYGHPGESSVTAKLTEDDVRAIRERYASGERQVALGAEYGITHARVSQIVRRVAWAHV